MLCFDEAMTTSMPTASRSASSRSLSKASLVAGAFAWRGAFAAVAPCELIVQVLPYPVFELPPVAGGVV